jgi:CheY-like chemotaxis protein
MSHEIRTPLNAIIGFSQLMNRERLLTDSQKEYVSSITRAGEHLFSLINDILELSKMEAGHLLLNPNHVDLHALFADIHLLFKETARSKHLWFIFEPTEDLPQYVVVDESKLRRIFINLIGNAIKFTDEGGIAVRAKVDKISNEKGILVVEVQDSGHGIAESELDKLFKPFEQTSAGIKKSHGTGLGLALSRELAELMGGDITVISEEEKGSIFIFKVLIQIGNAGSIETKITKRVKGIDNAKELYRILVVDDKPENLKVVTKLLKLAGFETREAISGAVAIEVFNEWDPHLILMDIRMPGMNGYETTHHIRSTKKGAHVPIISLTASSFEEERRKILAAGIQGHIRKPFRENDLFGTIGKTLGIEYIYEEENLIPKPNLLNNISLAQAIASLPENVVMQMNEATAVADFDQLAGLIHNITPTNAALSNHLMELLNNYDYDGLQKILTI